MLTWLSRRTGADVTEVHRIRGFRVAVTNTRADVSTELTFLARRDIGPAVVAASVLHAGVHARIYRLTRTARARVV